MIHAERFRSGVIHLRRYTNGIPLPFFISAGSHESVKRTTLQFSFEQSFEMFQCTGGITEVGSPFQMVGAAWLKARSVNFSLFLGMCIIRSVFRDSESPPFVVRGKLGLLISIKRKTVCT